MSLHAGFGIARETAGRLWRFGDFEFDELSRVLRVRGAVVELEAKPLEVLSQLLLRAGEVVSKEELLDAAWPGVSVVEGSLPTAVSKLRKALGDSHGSIIVTVPRTGYRTGVPVECAFVAAVESRELRFAAGAPVPGRDQWRFVRKLEASAESAVWVAEHPKTHALRVFKFAADGVRLRALKREVTLARVLRDALGERPEFVRVLEWNFDVAPYYIESEYSGVNLAEWAEQRGGLSAIPLEERLRAIRDIAAAVAAAHSAGVLHKDLKPANVLMSGSADAWQVKLVDFGSGALLEPSRLGALGITNLGFTATTNGDSGALTGTLMYLPPEVLAGQAPTAAADVYALGVLLYQAVAGDFRRPLSPGWESNVEAPLLREDIAAAACGDAARRLGSVAELVSRIDGLELRRRERDEVATVRERARLAERQLELAGARRPWIVAAGVALALGMAASLVLYANAAKERDRANRQTEIAASVNKFLGQDLLGRSDPFQSGAAEVTLARAVRDASPDIDRQFRNAPEVAARLHQTIARAMDNRSEFDQARREYEQAAALFTKSEGALSQDAVVVKLQQAAMEARSYQKGSVQTARAIVTEETPAIVKLQKPRPDIAVWLAHARGMIALIDNDAKGAAKNFGEAYERSEKLPEFDETARLTFKQKLAFAHIRLGDGSTAERLFRELIAAFSRTSGPDGASVLRVRLNLAQAFMIENKNREAIDEVNRIYPQYVARLGENHELTMQLLTTRAQCEATEGMWADSIRDDLAIYRLALQKQGPTSFFAVATLADAALAQCRGGHVQEGEANAHKVYDIALKAFGSKAGLTGGSAYVAASCEIASGKLADASSMLAGIDPKPVAQLTGFPEWSANVDLARAEIAVKERDFETARKYLDAARPAFAKPDAEAYQKRTVERLTAAVGQ